MKKIVSLFNKKKYKRFKNPKEKKVDHDCVLKIKVVVSISQLPIVAAGEELKPLSGQLMVLFHGEKWALLSHGDASFLPNI